MTTLFADSFAGADANPIGGDWTTVTGENAMRRVSNKIQGSTASVENGAYVNSVSPPANQWAQALFAFTDNNVAYSADGGPTVRMSDSVEDYYWFDQGKGTTVVLGKLVSGAFTSLGGGSTQPVLNDACYIEAVGTQITVKINGTTEVSVADSAISAAEHFGMATFHNDMPWASFTAGDFATGTWQATLGLPVASINARLGLARTSIKEMLGLTP